MKSEEGLERGLRNRHIQMIGLGGAIGVGLFLGSGAAIHRTGPSLLLSFALGGVIVFLLLRALGELALYRPVSGSFSSYASEFLGPFAGFFSGWTYWITYVLQGMAEMTAVALYIQYWFPGAPQWTSVLVVLGLLLGANLLSVRVFGESEFWFALIKVTAIVAVILIGFAVLLFGIGGFSEAKVSNLWTHGGFFPNGLLAPLLAMQIVLFSFFGLETVGIAAGETDNPSKSLPAAINRVVLRIIIFYLGSLAVIMSLVAWDQLDPKGSPFVALFDQLGIPAAASIINFVVITAALSAGNSAFFVTTRMLFSLSDRKQAPRLFKRLNKRKIPAPALIVSAVMMVLGVIVNYLVPERAFAYIASIATLGGLTTWAVIVLAHLRYRRAVAHGRIQAGGFRMPGAPWSGLLVLLALVGVTVLLGLSGETRIALYVAPIWVGVLVIAYTITHRVTRHSPQLQPGQRAAS